MRQKDETAVAALLMAGLLFAAGVFFVLGAYWHSQVIAPVEMYTPVTPATSAPAVPFTSTTVAQP